MNILKCYRYLNRSLINSQNSFFTPNRLFEGSKIYRIDRAISTVDLKDIKHNSNFKNSWWDENGPVKLLHSFNPLRVQFVRDGLANAGIKLCNPALPLEGVKIADIGCGGGILTESLARIGAHVTGLDASAELINLAKEHIKLDPTILERVNYIHTSIEEFSPKNERLYDVVTSEIIEHVENPEIFLKECVRVLKPGGSIFVTTINKTNILARCYCNSGCKTKLIHGIKVNPLTNQCSWSSFTAINYGLHAVKQRENMI
ncbi:hypothetical protein ACFW04_004339 [Cataglyphis niger]